VSNSRAVLKKFPRVSVDLRLKLREGEVKGDEGVGRGKRNKGIRWKRR